MFIHKSHMFLYGVLAGNQCRGLGVVARPVWSSPVLHKVFVFVSPEMWLSVHSLPPLQLHPGTVLYPAVFPALSPSASPAAPKRRKGLSSPELTMALPLLTASASHQEHTAQVRLSQLHCIFRSCGIKDLQTTLGASRQGRRNVIMSFPKRGSIQTESEFLGWVVFY